MRREIGALCMKTRVMKGNILLAKDLTESKNKMVREVRRRVKGDERIVWNKKVEEYLEEVGITFKGLINIRIYLPDGWLPNF